MARVAADDEGGPAAFGVRLSGINKNGRPSEPKRIHVRNLAGNFMLNGDSFIKLYIAS